MQTPASTPGVVHAGAAPSPVCLRVETRDPLIFRDSRPFGQGGTNRHRPLAWPMPQTMAGALRTLVGKALNLPFDAPSIERLLTLSVSGPLPEFQGKLLFPAPLDLLWHAPAGQPEQVLPLRPAGGESALRPPALAQLAARDQADGSEFKPSCTQPFVSLDWMAKWLAELRPVPPLEQHMPSAETESRVQIGIDDETGCAQDELLFVTAGFRLHHGYSISFRATCTEQELLQAVGTIHGYHPMGGERRLAWLKAEPRLPDGYACPGLVAQSLHGATRIRMALATPALFRSGWLPSWLEAGSVVPGTKVTLRLVSAAVGRWLPVAGWSYDRRTFGPKAIRRLAPAGSVYFCELVDGDPAELASAWMAPVSDDPQDRRDGYGLALWGTWKGQHA